MIAFLRNKYLLIAIAFTLFNIGLSYLIFNLSIKWVIAINLIFWALEIVYYVLDHIYVTDETASQVKAQILTQEDLNK